MTTLIKNGTIITATDIYKADVLVKNGVITEIGSEISKIASEIIDAADKWVLPGAVDVHTHMDVQCDGMTTVDDFETGTTAAAARRPWSHGKFPARKFLEWSSIS